MLTKIIKIPSNLNIIFKDNNLIIINLLKKTSQLKINNKLNIIIKDNSLNLFYNDNNLIKKQKILLNLFSSLIKNEIIGLTKGFKVQLLLKGIGYKASLDGNNLILKLGFSHEIFIEIPENIKININKKSNIVNLIIIGNNLKNLTQFANKIKKYRLPEPYKGKGIFFKNETILTKEGKKSKK